jgi:hypothetical protein
METFNNFRRVMEDTLRVDMEKRWTPQIVKFINNKNEFYGFFNGKIDVNGGVLNDVSLSNVTIYKPNGETLNIDKIIEMSDKFDDYDMQFVTISNIITADIPYQLKQKIDELSIEVYSDIESLNKKIYDETRKLSNEITTKIESSNETVYKTITDVSNELSIRIDNVDETILNNKNELSSKLSSDVYHLNSKIDTEVTNIYLSIDSFEQYTKNEFE